MSAERGGFGSRLLIVLFASAIVAIAGHQISVKYVGKKTSSSGTKGKALVAELHGEVDVARASVSPEYVEQYANGDKGSEAATDKDSTSDKNSGHTFDKKGLKNLLDKLSP